MSAQNSAGIQTLLDAEREAQKIVQKAREYRTKRVKDARSEAQKEIEEYRKQKDGEFKAFEKEVSSYILSLKRPLPPTGFVKTFRESAKAMLMPTQQHTSGNKKAEEDAQKDADAQVKAIKDAGGKSGDDVVKELLRIVMEVKPEVPDRVQAPS